MAHYKYLFIGGGIASISTINNIIKYSKDAIAIINNEPYLPYKRTQLSKKLTGNEISNNFALFDADWYIQNNIQLINNEAINIEPLKNSVSLYDGRKITYDYLIIATGLHANVPLILGIQPQDVHVLRTIRQANDIIEVAKKAKTILVIGGGVEGVEVASQMVKLGKQVTIIDKNNRLMHRNLSESNSSYLQEQAEARGVSVLTGTTIKDGAKLDNGTFIIRTNNGACQADMIIAAVGALPNTKLAQTSGIEINLGIEVNEYLQTNIPNIYAAGDVVDIPSHKNHHLWHQAEYMGQCVAENLLGNPTKYQHKPFRLKTEVFDCYIFSLNIEAQNSPLCQTILETRDTKKRTLYIINDHIKGIEMINDEENAKLYQQAVWENWTLKELNNAISIK